MNTMLRQELIGVMPYTDFIKFCLDHKFIIQHGETVEGKYFAHAVIEIGWHKIHIQSCLKGEN